MYWLVSRVPCVMRVVALFVPRPRLMNTPFPPMPESPGRLTNVSRTAIYALVAITFRAALNVDLKSSVPFSSSLHIPLVHPISSLGCLVFLIWRPPARLTVASTATGSSGTTHGSAGLTRFMHRGASMTSPRLGHLLSSLCFHWSLVILHSATFSSTLKSGNTALRSAAT